MPTETIIDPVTGRTTYEYTYTGSGDWRTILSATDHDTADAFSWARYTVTYRPQNVTTQVLESATSVMDDGSSFTFENLFVIAIGNIALDNGDRTTARDVAGRLDYVLEIYGNLVPHTGPIPQLSRALDYDPATGRLDYAVTRYRDGRVLSEDFDLRTGALDFSITTHADGRIVSQDHDPVRGGVDYEMTRHPDGRVVATDHDLADEHPWTTYTIAYDATGRIESVSVL